MRSRRRSPPPAPTSVRSISNGDAARALSSTTLEGGPHLAEQLDVRDLASHEPLLRRATEAFGRFDVLANTAAVLVRRDDVDDVTEEDWDLQHDVNLKAAFFLNRAAGTSPPRAGLAAGGSSTSRRRAGGAGGFGGSVAYAATKGGIVSMSRGLARTYAPDGITVNTVVSGRGRHGDDAQRARPTSSCRRRSTRSRWATSPSPPIWPGSSCSSPPTTPATSPARRSTSAAAG